MASLSLILADIVEVQKNQCQHIYIVSNCYFFVLFYELQSVFIANAQYKWIASKRSRKRVYYLALTLMSPLERILRSSE